MANQIGEELAYIQAKAYAKTIETAGKELMKMLEKMLNMAREKDSKLKGGECNLQKLLESKSAINQIKVDEKHLKDLVKEAKRYSTPVAVVKTINDEYKILFKSEDTEIINSIMQDLISKQLKDNTKVIDGISITKSSNDDKISFKNEEGKEVIGSIKDKAGVVKSLQETLELKPRKALELYIEATKVEAKEIDVTKLKSKNKLTFKDGNGREYSAKLETNRDTVIKGLQKTFGLNQKDAEKLYQKAMKQTVKSKLAEIANKHKNSQQHKLELNKNQDKGAR